MPLGTCQAKGQRIEMIKATLSTRDWEEDPAKRTLPISNTSTYACVIMVLSENPVLRAGQTAYDAV